MKLLERLLERLKTPPRDVDPEAEAEAERLRYQMDTVRLSQKAGSAGENYQSGRASK